MGCGVQQLWQDLSSATVLRTSFDTFCNNIEFYEQTLQCLEEAQDSCDEHTPDGVSSVVDMFRLTMQGICAAGACDVTAQVVHNNIKVYKFCFITVQLMIRTACWKLST